MGQRPKRASLSFAAGGVLALGLLFPAAHLASRALADTPKSQPPTSAATTVLPEAHPYMDEPLKQLVKRVPQLKDMRPVASQDALPEILKKTGERVDDFFRHITDLTAREDITLSRYKQELPTTHPEVISERVGDTYLILRHSGQGRAEIVEYRTDPKGGNFDQTLVKQGYTVTSGFALACNYFATAFLPESRFRLLGEQNVGGHETYVVGFAQQPGKATMPVRIRGRTGAPVNMLVQGVAWIDTSDFQIVRLRTDLLTPRWDVGVNQQTTEVMLKKVQLADVAAPLWLPSTVKVFVEFTTHNGDVDEFYELSYKNEHRYSNYQRYRVATKIVPQ